MATHNHYSKFLARIYDSVLHVPGRKIRKEVAQTVLRTGGRRIIDMCCGTGNQLAYLQSMGLRDIVGIDISDNMLNQAKRNGLGGVCRKMDASATIFNDNSFDAAVMSFVLHETHAHTARGILDEAKRIVKPGGTIIIVDYSFDEHTHPLGRFATQTVERFVGGDHYRNFRHFISQQLLMQITMGLIPHSKKNYMMGAVGIWVFENT